MAVGLGFGRRISFAGRTHTLTALGLIALAGCDGDSLVDGPRPDVDPPAVAIASPVTGDEVLAGRQIPVRVTATDEDGVVSLDITIGGSFSAAVSRVYDPPLPLVQFDTLITVPDAAAGAAQINATATNTRAALGAAEAVLFNVAQVDSIAPAVAMTALASLTEGDTLETLDPNTAVRLEVRDSILVRVRAVDNTGGSGIRRVGATIVVASSTRADTLAVTMEEELASAAADTVEVDLFFAPPFVDPAALPDSMVLEIYGWAVDDDGTCAAAITDNLEQSLRCLGATYDGQSVTVATLPAEAQPAIAVRGRSKALVEKGTVADLLVDTLRSRAYLSNLSRNKINTFLPSTFDWGSDVLVGAEPWGLALNIDQDTLFVGNSGSNSISFVSVTGTTPREDLSRRFLTRNTPLFEVRKDSAQTEAGRRRYDGTFLDFSDRPQFMAQDSTGRLLYSTKPTVAQANGTLRVVVDQPGWSEPEARILIRPEDVITEDTATISIANIDSLVIIQSAGEHDLVNLFDHRAGFPDQLISTGPMQLEAAVEALSNNPDSDIFWRYGNFNLLAVGLADTTYVDASGNRQWVAFGEGGQTRPSRIILWDAGASRIHSALLVVDLVNNASEQVRGLDLNEDGSLGASRGKVASYFFQTDLRLRGSVSEVTLGGSSTVLHPDHPDYVQGLPSSERTVAFLSTGDDKIKILDTVHFTERGELEIRDQIAGVLRSAPPLPTDNGGTGRNCAGSSCIVAKLYGVTDRGHLVVIDIRRSDILPLP